MEIGNLGERITFRTSSKKILTFKDFKQKISARWVTHEIIGAKPKSEFLGPELRKIDFKVDLDITLGIKPRQVIKQLETMIETGEAAILVVGGQKIGDNQWKVIEMSEAWDIILTEGELARATLSLTLEEYI